MDTLTRAEFRITGFKLSALHIQARRQESGPAIRYTFHDSQPRYRAEQRTIVLRYLRHIHEGRRVLFKCNFRKRC